MTKKIIKMNKKDLENNQAGWHLERTEKEHLIINFQSSKKEVIKNVYYNNGANNNNMSIKLDNAPQSYIISVKNNGEWEVKPNQVIKYIKEYVGTEEFEDVIIRIFTHML